MKNKTLLFRYYWENLKTDLARTLMTDKKNLEFAKQASCQIFSVQEIKREMFCKEYSEYKRLSFVVEYMDWRQAKCLFKNMPFTFDWEE